MEHICDNCRYIDTEGKWCLFINGAIPKSNTCEMYKVSLKKEIERMKEEMQECNDGACKISR